MTSLYITVNVKSFDNPVIEEKELCALIRKEKQSSKADIEANKLKEEIIIQKQSELLKKIRSKLPNVCKNTLIKGVTSENKINIEKLFEQLKNLDSGVVELAGYIQSSNLISDSDVLFYLIESKSIYEKESEVSGEMCALQEFYNESGIGEFSFFKGIKNNRLCLKELSKEEFINVVKEKFAILREQLSWIKPIPQEIESLSQSIVNYDLVKRCIFNKKSVKRNIFYSKKNNQLLKKILYEEESQEVNVVTETVC